MRALRRVLDRIAPLFARGGRLERLGAVYEMIDTLLYAPADVTATAPHVRDAIDLKRVMILVVIAVLPAAAVGIWSVGHEANLAIREFGALATGGWRSSLLALIGVDYDPDGVVASFLHGMLWFLPIYLVTLAVGGFWEVTFAAARNHEVNEGFLVTSMLFALTLPATTPLWQVALGISFGVVIGKEVFGGTGKNFLNPALVGRAFLYFAYPASQSGDAVWVPVDGYSGATALALAAEDGVTALTRHGIEWSDAFFGVLQGSIGEVSTAACLVGAAILVYTRIASWRIMIGMLAGLVATTLIVNAFADEGDAYLALPWYWHAVLGGYAFGLVFMATDPVSASMTRIGKFAYGALIGFLTVLIRVFNPAYPEGTMLAILFGNMVAPLIDYAVVQANVRRRRRRNAV
jgi:Na+-transporting NADH:ubiquinone oxidoreductase subunit B